MREIEFRGKGNPEYNDGSWYQGYLKYDGEVYQILDPIHGICARTVISETVGQYTAKDDKNGNRIYEGDITKYIEPCGTTTYGVVKFGDYKHANGEHTGFYIDWCNDDTLREDLRYWIDKVEIIGNIHDNPEPLETEKS